MLDAQFFALVCFFLSLFNFVINVILITHLKFILNTLYFFSHKNYSRLGKLIKNLPPKINFESYDARMSKQTFNPVLCKIRK